ncbi:hypothetical protein DIPPA_20450 [Diplonema papillatum]|nr:hypothetical protein DIPPA_20450 [Diplonema papillatum]
MYGMPPNVAGGRPYSPVLEYAVPPLDSELRWDDLRRAEQPQQQLQLQHQQQERVGRREQTQGGGGQRRLQSYFEGRERETSGEVAASDAALSDLYSDATTEAAQCASDDVEAVLEAVMTGKPLPRQSPTQAARAASARSLLSNTTTILTSGSHGHRDSASSSASRHPLSWHDPVPSPTSSPAIERPTVQGVMLYRPAAGSLQRESSARASVEKYPPAFIAALQRRYGATQWNSLTYADKLDIAMANTKGDG